MILRCFDKNSSTFNRHIYHDNVVFVISKFIQTYSKASQRVYCYILHDIFGFWPPLLQTHLVVILSHYSYTQFRVFNDKAQAIDLTSLV